MTPAEVPDALVEKAARARWDAEPTTGLFKRYDDLDDHTRELLDNAERHALAAVLPEIRAQALNDAANDWQRGEWANAPRRANQVQERIANGQYVGDWLRDRAARLTTTEEPTT